VRKESPTLRPIRVITVRKSLIEIEKALLRPVNVFVVQLKPLAGSDLHKTMHLEHCFMRCFRDERVVSKGDDIFFHLFVC